MITQCTTTTETATLAFIGDFGTSYSELVTTRPSIPKDTSPVGRSRRKKQARKNNDPNYASKKSTTFYRDFLDY